MEVILRAKPNVDATDAKKMTALHVAAGKCNVELVKLLVRRVAIRYLTLRGGDGVI